MTSTDRENPLLDLHSIAIPFDRIRAEHVKPGVATLLERARAAVRRVADATRPLTYAGTLGALEDATEELGRAMGVISHLESVATTPELREAYNAVKPDVSAFYTSIPLDPDLWRTLQAYAATDDAKGLEPIRARHLGKTIDEMRRHGADLDVEGKKQLEAIDVELSTLTTKFSQNLLDSTNAFELVVKDAAKLAGLPESALAAARASAQQKGHADGWRFTLQAPSVMAVLTYLDDAAIRETIWRAYNTRASSGDHDNRAHLLRILELRRAKAKLLGHPDFADLVLEDRMAKRGDDATRFVRDLEDKTRAAFDREGRELEAFRAKVTGKTEPMRPWDVGYWAEKQRKALYDFDEEALRPYFRAERVLEGVFEIASRLYGIKVEPWADAPTWDPSVRTFRVRDPKRGELLGAFYVDLYPRESKRGGAWMAGLITGGPIEGGGFSPHLGLFCSNASPPIDDAPALLTHDEVETLFHEFGHLLHHLLSRVPVKSLAGTSVAWDFVELPSQIMENWTWERDALDLFARHHATGDAIPAELFERMQKARTYRAASAQMRQLGFASVDLALHRVYDSAKDGDPIEYARKTMERFSATQLPAGYAMITGFSHLFAHPVGYAAGYYSYKWAEVLDADAFGRFKREGLFSPEVGAQFRDRLLSRGDAADPMHLFIDFMGREPDLAALLERNGLLETSSAPPD